MISGLYSTYGLYAKFQSNDLNRRDDIQYIRVDEIIILKWMIKLLQHYVPLCSVAKKGDGYVQ
jgi:hypothetical protein